MPFVNKTEELLFYAVEAARMSEHFDKPEYIDNRAFHRGREFAYLQAACILNNRDWTDEIEAAFAEQWLENRAYRMPPEE